MNQRKAVRYCTDDVVLVEVAPQKVVPASVRDVSRTGLSIGVQIPIASGTHVKVMFPGDVVIFGEVRHCQREDKGFQAGILIHEMQIPQEAANQDAPEEPERVP